MIRAERHGALAIVTVAAIVLVAEGDSSLVERDQPAVRDGDTVGVPRQIGEHRLRSAEVTTTRSETPGEQDRSLLEAGGEPTPGTRSSLIAR